MSRQTAAQAAAAAARSVFVGNIPYDMTEEQLAEIFKEVGPVVSFRLMFVRDTGKPRGYGFCEFQDTETAASAVRNLNNYDVGGRLLRVDYAENNPSTEKERGGGGAGGPLIGRPDDRDFREQPQRDLPPREFPLQRDVPNRGLPGQGALFAGGLPAGGPPNEQAISNTLGSMNPTQLFDFISQMKMFTTQSPEQARALLVQSPQISYALFQALLMMNLVDPKMLQRVLHTSPGIPLPPMNAAQQPPPQQPPPHPSMPGYMDMGGASEPYSAGPSMMSGKRFASAPHPLPPKPMMPYVPTNHTRQQPPTRQGPPQQPPPQPQSVPPAALSFEEHQKQLLMQVLNLTQAQIDSLPPDQRASVQALKQQIMMGQGAS